MIAPRTRLVWVAILMLVGSGRAHADHVAEAKQHFVIGNDRYAAGRYDEALREFTAGYAIVPNPKFLLNMGQTYRKLGRLDEARAALSKYADTLAAGDPRRGDVALVIAEIDHQLREQSPPLSLPAAPQPTAAAPPVVAEHASPATTATAQPDSSAPSLLASSPRPVARRRARIAGAAITAAGGAAVAIGGVLVGLAVRDNRTLANPPPNAVFDPAVVRERDTFYPAGLSVLAVGVALVAGGTGTLIYFSKR